MSDCFQRAVIEEHSIVLGLAVTTSACRHAQSLQNLAPASAIALSRMLTASALIGLLQNRMGGTSLQMVGSGDLGQVYADVNDSGHLRGYVKNPSVNLEGEHTQVHATRALLGPLMGEGEVSMIRMGLDNQFTQSTTSFQSGEIDEDIGAFIQQSDQIPTQIHCEVLLNEHSAVACAGGIVVQGMPGTNLEEFHAIRERIRGDGFRSLLEQFPAQWKEIIHAVAPNSRVLNGDRPLKWQCRCSREKVLSALTMFGPMDMADMIEKNENPGVTCDFCKKVYTVSKEEVLKMYSTTITTGGN